MHEVDRCFRDAQTHLQHARRFLVVIAHALTEEDRRKILDEDFLTSYCARCGAHECNGEC